jgi:solute carrier family 5 (sodium-dependent multivitamin transporter), member 6
MKAVMWTDTFQIIMMLIGLLSSLIKGIIDVGGIKRIVEINSEYDRIEFFM